MAITTYRECLPGARNVLKNCLAVKPNERVLLVTAPYNIDPSTIVSASSVTWWAKTLCSSESPSCKEALEQMMKEVLDMQLALSSAAEELGATATPFTLDTRTLLGNNFMWKDKSKASKLLSFLREWDVIVDMTLFGLDEIPTTKKSRKLTNLREEILQGSRVRGVDIHAPARLSFVDGAMCADYVPLAPQVRAFADRLRKVDSLKITGKGTDLTLNIDRCSVSIGTGLIHEPESRWHFLPSGVVFAVVKKTGNYGTITLDGPMYGVPSLKGHPLTLEIVPGVGAVGRRHLSEGAPAIVCQLVEDMFSIKECNFIGEIVFGLNPKGNIDSAEPMEFYTAQGGVTIAFGRNDHIGGDIIRSSSSSFSVHTHASIRDATVTLENGDKLIKDGRIQK